MEKNFSFKENIDNSLASNSTTNNFVIIVLDTVVTLKGILNSYKEN